MADSSATGVHTYWLNGIVKINGVDAATINEVDGGVVFSPNMTIVEHSGSRPYPCEVHATGGTPKVKIGQAAFKMQQLVKLLSFTQEVGVLADAITPAALFSFNNGTKAMKAVVVQLLIQGTKSGTNKKVEIYAGKAVLTGKYDWSLDKDKMAKEDLEFSLLGDPTDREANVCQIRDEDLGS
jgi:hypothetical protein